MTPAHPKSKIVCECFKVTEDQLVKAIRARKLKTLKDVAHCTSAGEGCNVCHPLIKEYLERERRQTSTYLPPPHRPVARTDTVPALSL